MHPLTPSWYNSRNDLKRIDNITSILGTGVENIKVIENWISDEDAERAMDIIKKYPVKENAHHSYPIHTLKEYDQTREDFLFEKEFAQKMTDSGQEVYGLPLLRDKRFLYVVHPTGTYIDPHTDILHIHDNDYENESLDEQIKRYPYLWSGHLSILAYLNDDYEGGELYFPDLDYSIKPKKGMLILFPGSLHYQHGVTPVTSGTRYTLSQWSRFKDFIEEYPYVTTN